MMVQLKSSENALIKLRPKKPVIRTRLVHKTETNRLQPDGGK
jgi:hypothetical protein